MSFSGLDKKSLAEIYVLLDICCRSGEGGSEESSVVQWRSQWGGGASGGAFKYEEVGSTVSLL